MTTLRTEEDDLALMDMARPIAAAEVMQIIRSPDPVTALARHLLLRDRGGEKARVHARAVYRLSGKSAEEAQAIVENLTTTFMAEGGR